MVSGGIATLTQADVAVIGAGPAGATVARCLARAGASVVLIDRGTTHRTVGESLPPGTTSLLQELGLWDRFLRDGHRPSYGNRSVWGSPVAQDYDFIQDAYGRGWHLDRLRFDVMLVEAARGAGVARLEGRAVGCRRVPDGGWVVTLASEGQRSAVQVSFVVDATGRARWVARSRGVRRVAHDRLVAEVGVWESSESGAPVDSRTMVEAVENGWWYTAPLPDGRLVVAYLSDADLLTAGMAGWRTEWRSRLDETSLIRDRLVMDQYALAGELYRVSAESARADVVWGDGWCAVGDAAAAFDPLSSQGIMTSLMSGMRAAEAILHGTEQAFAAYEAWLVQVYARYLARWLSYYALEDRWPHQLFWRRRHQALEDLLGR